MKSISKLSWIFVLAILIGCQNGTETAQHSDSHDHDDGTHTHADGTTHSNHSFTAHSHDNPPHGGTYADWGGGKYHVEFTVDHDKQQATVYILGGDAVTAAPIAAESINLALTQPQTQISLTADPQDGDADGKSSRFVGTHENLAKAQNLEGKIYGNVDGKAYSGTFKQ